MMTIFWFSCIDSQFRSGRLKLPFRVILPKENVQMNRFEKEEKN